MRSRPKEIYVRRRGLGGCLGGDDKAGEGNVGLVVALMGGDGT